MFGIDEAISRTLIHDVPMSPYTNGGINEMSLEGTKLPLLLSNFLNPEEQYGTNFSNLEEVPPNTSLLVIDNQATHNNEYTLFSEIVVSDDKLLLDVSLPS